MDPLLNLFLPLSLAIIMFSLGLGLTVADFTRVAKAPKAFTIGAVAQLLILPAVAFTMLLIFPMEPALAVGVMILSFCPGGVTSNIITKLAKGSVALSISLTGLISLMSILTIPLFIALSAQYFMGGAAPEISVLSLGATLVVITAIPVILGLLIRARAEHFARRIEPSVTLLANGLFTLIVILAIGANYPLFLENWASLGLFMVGLNVIMLAIGLGLSRAGRLDREEGTAIALEAGVQNSALGITLGSLLVSTQGEISVFALPSAVYGLTCYVVTIPFVIWLRRRARQGASGLSPAPAAPLSGAPLTAPVVAFGGSRAEQGVRQAPEAPAPKGAPHQAGPDAFKVDAAKPTADAGRAPQSGKAATVASPAE